MAKFPETLNSAINGHRLRAFILISYLGLFAYASSIIVDIFNHTAIEKQMWVQITMCAVFALCLVVGKILKIYRPIILLLQYSTFLALIVIILNTSNGAAAGAFNYFFVLVLSASYFLGKWHALANVILSVIFFTSFLIDFYEKFNIEIPNGLVNVDQAVYSDRIIAIIVLGLLSHFFVKLNDLYQTSIHKLSQYEENEKKFKMLKVITSGFAHEINNPLTIASAAAELIEKNTTNTKTKHLTQKILSSVNRAASITQRLVTFHNLNVEIKEKVNISELVNTICSSQKNLFSERVIINKIDPNESITTNYNAITEILLAIIVNAVEASEGINGAKIIFSFDKTSRTLHIFNSGSPITLDLANNATQLFKTTKLDRPGRGVGLFTVELFCNKLGYKFSLSPSEGGNTAQIELDII